MIYIIYILKHELTKFCWEGQVRFQAQLISLPFVSPEAWYQNLDPTTQLVKLGRYGQWPAHNSWRFTKTSKKHCLRWGEQSHQETNKALDRPNVDVRGQCQWQRKYETLELFRPQCSNRQDENECPGSWFDPWWSSGAEMLDICAFWQLLL